jgi:peptidyl-prolyl cis-trans isomerase B (cyclophilin B)
MRSRTLTRRVALTAFCSLLFFGCAKKAEKGAKVGDEPSSARTAASSDVAPAKKVAIETNMGKIVVALDGERAPITVKNFTRYAKEGFYNGTIFHRVIKTFMIQGGGFTEARTKKPTHDPIKNEADNGLKNKRGTIAMARTPNPHSATGQFFINVVDNAF